MRKVCGAVLLSALVTRGAATCNFAELMEKVQSVTDGSMAIADLQGDPAFQDCQQVAQQVGQEVQIAASCGGHSGGDGGHDDPPHTTCDSYDGFCFEGMMRKGSETPCWSGECTQRDCCANFCHMGTHIECPADQELIHDWMIPESALLGHPSCTDRDHDAVGDQCDETTCCAMPCHSWSGTCQVPEDAMHDGFCDPTVEGDCELQCCERPCVDLENMFACPEGTSIVPWEQNAVPISAAQRCCTRFCDPSITCGEGQMVKAFESCHGSECHDADKCCGEVYIIGDMAGFDLDMQQVYTASIHGDAACTTPPPGANFFGGQATGVSGVCQSLQMFEIETETHCDPLTGNCTDHSREQIRTIGFTGFCGMAAGPAGAAGPQEVAYEYITGHHGLPGECLAQGTATVDSAGGNVMLNGECFLASDPDDDELTYVKMVCEQP